MINDDLNRENPRDPLYRDNLRTVEPAGIGSGWIMLMAAVAVFAVLFMWAPWSGPRVADNTAPGTTVGSSTSRPSAPITAPVPTAPAPTAPAAPVAPSTTK